MKKMKKLLSLVLSVAMVVAMGITTFAADKTVNITVPTQLEHHTFVAYQIFKGDETNTKNQLVNVEWGEGINSTKFLEKLKNDSNFGTEFQKCQTPQDVADALGKTATSNMKAITGYVNESKKGNGIQLKSGNNTLAEGYYLIQDTYSNDANKDYAVNANLLKVTSDFEITVKTDKPSVEKKVKENTKYSNNGGYGEGYNDVADYNIGDSVPFKLIGTIPNMENYSSYKNYTFKDTLSNGLTLDEKSISVYLANKKDAEAGAALGSDQYTVKKTGQSFSVSIKDLKAVADGHNYVIVKYNATLNSSAVIGLDGNTNEVYLEYSNNPENPDGKGETPKDKVIVFTYELDTTKVDGQNKNTKLKNAEFKLYNSNNQYAKVDGNGKITGWGSEAEATTLKSDSNGLFKVIGLDAGTYYLKETKAPEGYNSLKDSIQLTITATTANDQEWNGTASNALTELNLTVGGTISNGNITTGIVSTTVENNKGSILPSTGGIGTTIFYVIGGILMVGAGVILVSRTRRSK